LGIGFRTVSTSVNGRTVETVPDFGNGAKVFHVEFVSPELGTEAGRSALLRYLNMTSDTGN